MKLEERHYAETAREYALRMLKENIISMELKPGAMVSENELAAVHPRLLVRLFASPLGVRMLAAEELHREWAFTYRRETEDGAQLLQGVIDCCFLEDGAWVLLDYKTEAHELEPEALAQYRAQLEYYRRALVEVTGLPVKECLLCLVMQRKIIDVSRETTM